MLDRISDDSPPGTPQLTVLSLNTLQGRADIEVVGDLIGAERPDLVALPEAGVRFRDRLAPLVEPLGYRMLASPPDVGGSVGNMTVLVASRLGAVQAAVGRDTAFPYLELTGGSLGELRVVAIHPVAPRQGSVEQWRHDLEILGRWCASGTPAIIAGDLNATLDHSVLRDAMQGCTDAAAQQGEGLAGTWPAGVPRWLGVQIDHVLTTKGINAQSFEIFDVLGSDHRAVLARLSLP